MLEAIGVNSIDDLFAEIPQELRARGLNTIASGLNEMEIGRKMQELAAKDGQPLCFIGAGAYEHHIPAAVWEIATRGEFYSAYTPYQAEASQGTLQLVYEFQSMIASLMGLEVSNASLYDGASALAEAVLMAIRANRQSKSNRILMPKTVNPDYVKVVDAIVSNQGITLELIEYDRTDGAIDPAGLTRYQGEDFAALVIPQPNFFGIIEEVDQLTDWAHSQQALVIGVVNPLAMALLTPPGEWGSEGADIAVGEGQPLGIPLSSGGPYFGFMATRQKLVRQMPGRIVGRTVDLDGKPGFTLTLQAREQHIRRSKATSNICTNQGLMATAATIYMAIVGADGIRNVALASHQNTQKLLKRLTEIEGVECRFNRPFFHEIVLTLPQAVDEVLKALAVQDILGGYQLSLSYGEHPHELLLCATECRNEDDIEQLATNLERILSRRNASPVCTKLKPTDPAVLAQFENAGES
jgi:glycine dehydrogenase subunit 1